MALTLHQALHGYSEGHRQLACSVQLTTRDARLMLVMSDVSGPGVAQTGQPYLTGYPLTESGFYAFSKTWPAPEMPRPGCVWTHTILIEFSDLAALDTPSAIEKLFERPEPVNLHVYQAPSSVELNDAARGFSSQEEAELYSRMATALYENPQEQVWARRSEDLAAEAAVLALWDQQWPRLRRSFKFCTLTTRDRSQDGLVFDLQLAPGHGTKSTLRMASSGEGVEASSVTSGIWLQELVRDASSAGRGPLRRTLRVLGADVLGGREAMLPICALQAAMSGPVEIGLRMAMNLVQTVPPLTNSDAAKSLVVRYVLNESWTLSDDATSFVLDHLHLLGEHELGTYADILCRALWRSDPRALLALTRDGGNELREEFTRAARALSMEDVIAALPTLSEFAPPLLHLFPTLATKPEFWAATQAWPPALASEEVDVKSVPVFLAIMQGLSDERAISSALHMVRSPFVLLCAQTLLDEKLDEHGEVRIYRWVRFACNDLEGVAGFLAHMERPSLSVLRLIADTVHPDAVPNDIGGDPWLHALSRLSSSTGPLSVDLCAYAFRRALGWRSRSAVELMSLSFEPLHQTVLRGELPESVRRPLEASLPWAPRPRADDLALRLRQAMAKRLLSDRVGSDVLFSVVNDDGLFAELLFEIDDNWGGPSYLKGLAEERAARGSKSKRLRVLRDFVKRSPRFL